ncbi:hypothetical protein [Burkholderia diffusa]|nr:hypothetical protein [Burkholderia diffusa]
MGTIVTYKILRSDFSVWKHVKYLPMAQDIAARDIDAVNPVLFVVAVVA